MRRFVRGSRNQFRIIKQRALGRSQAGFIEVALKYGFDTLIGCSLNTQEVGMAVQSIRAPVQIGDVAGDHLLVPAREMAFGEMNRV